MHLFNTKDKVKGDGSTQLLMKQGVYHVPNQMYDHPFHMDSKAIKKKKIYGFWPGLKYTVILSILLFWMPPFGQVIAGYVGGRKAGTPTKGIFATLVPVVIIFLVFGLASLGALSSVEDFWNNTSESMSNTVSSIPLIGPIADFSFEYMGFLSDYIGLDNAWLAPYILTVLFGYVGGILSLQHKRELKEYEHVIQNTMNAPSVIQIQNDADPIVQPVISSDPNLDGQQAGTRASPSEYQDDNEQIGMDGDIPVVMGKKPDGWDEK